MMKSPCFCFKKSKHYIFTSLWRVVVASVVGDEVKVASAIMNNELTTVE